MSGEFQPEAACYGKTRYATEQVATDVAVKCWHERGVNLRSYACDCGGYHLTKMNAAPMMRPGWRPPAKSRRQLASERRADRRRR